ncbi:exported protein of unknown function [Hyphomicrobium sp. 1Nfss2.1]
MVVGRAMSASTPRSAAVGFALALAGGANAGEKAQHNLFNPTPRALMREMTTGRPDSTEVPLTVDAGHICDAGEAQGRPPRRG